MGHVVQGLRSLLFIMQMYVAMAVMALVFMPFALIFHDGAFVAVHAYCRWVRWTARWMVGLRSEIRGDIPTDEVLVAAKHQSFFDIIILVSALPRPKFIMKRELLWTPIVGWFAQRIGCVPVDRGRKGQAIRQMVEGVEKTRTVFPGQLIIYPQGTRVAPGVSKPYKIGPAILYEKLGQDCVPAATNVGVFWKRHGIYRAPGLAVVEFLPRIAAGAGKEQFMAEIETAIETASNMLMEEAGFNGAEQ